VRKRLWITALVGIGLAVVSTVLGAVLAWNALQRPLPIPADGTWLEVPSGASLKRVSSDLAQRGFLPHPALLTAYARLTGVATRVQAGEYQLTTGTTSLTLLAKLVAGQVYLHQVTIVEGWRFSDLLAALRSNSAIVPSSLSGAEIMTALGEPGVHPEGQFFPDTYSFPRGTAEIDVLRTAHAALRERLAKAWEHRSAAVRLETPYEALILASIIEKETALPSERRLISGVFHQRLQRNMRLQTDPTVIYGLGDAFDGNLRRRDLAHDTPYNTYTRFGLPPTPIALPGGDSIEAAVNPEITDAVYFVATGRGDGSHVFSATLEEHERAVQQYLKQLRAPAE
jgi:UPF0755 protein